MTLQHNTTKATYEITNQVKGKVYATVTNPGTSDLKTGDKVEIKPADIGVIYSPTI